MVRLLDQVHAVSVFRKIGEKLGDYATTAGVSHDVQYIAEQGFNQVLHMRSKCRSPLDMNKTRGNAIRLKLPNLQPAFKKFTDKKTGAMFTVVGTNCFWK